MTTEYLAAQPQRMFRISEDNDAFKLGQITDKAYTNGTRLEYFHRKKGESKSFVYSLMPEAGNESYNTLGWSIEQIMITPTDISRTVPEAGDYHYSGALFFTHGLQSANKARKLNLISEWVVGVMGPPSLAKETQIWVHELIGSPRPMGWDHQLSTDLLFNYNLKVEKGLANFYNFVEVVGGVQASAGTMLNGVSAYGVVKLAQHHSYFDDVVRQHSSDGKIKWYVIIKPTVDVILYNALLEGGFFSAHPTSLNSEVENGSGDLGRVGSRLDMGVGVAVGKFSLSLTQKAFSTLIDGLPEHNVGNITVGYAW